MRAMREVLVGAARFELATPSPPVMDVAPESLPLLIRSAHLASFALGLFSGDFVGCSGDLFGQDVRVTRGRLDVRVVQGLLHGLEVARFAQEFRSNIMPKIMKPEAINGRILPNPLPLKSRVSL